MKRFPHTISRSLAKWRQQFGMQFHVANFVQHNQVYRHFRGIFERITNYYQPLVSEERWLQQKTNGYWKSKENQLEYMNWLSQKLNIKTMEDWYKISEKVITKKNIQNIQIY